MTSVLILLSLCLHAITWLIILKLFKKIQSLKQDDAKEVTELLEQYLQDIKHENQQLQHALAEKEAAAESTRGENDVQHAKTQEETDIPYGPETDRVTDETVLSLEAKILQFHSDGISIEEIARQLNCGYTEAELIIKMNS